MGSRSPMGMGMGMGWRWDGMGRVAINGINGMGMGGSAGQGRAAAFSHCPYPSLQARSAAGARCSRSAAAPAAGPAPTCAWTGPAPAPSSTASASPAATAPRGWCWMTAGSVSRRTSVPAGTAASSTQRAARSGRAAMPGACRGDPGLCVPRLRRHRGGDGLRQGTACGDVVAAGTGRGQDGAGGVRWWQETPDEITLWPVCDGAAG